MSLYTYSQPRPPLEKTRICQYHLVHRCRYGSTCSFAHSSLELRVAPAGVRKTKLCPLFAAGLCFDSFCNYAHGYDEMRSSSCQLSPPLTPEPLEPPAPPSDQYSLLLNMLNQVLSDHDKVSLV